MTPTNPTTPAVKTAEDFLNERLAELNKTIADYNESLEVGKKEVLRGAFGFTKESVDSLEEKIAGFEAEKSNLLKAIETTQQQSIATGEIREKNVKLNKIISEIKKVLGKRQYDRSFGFSEIESIVYPQPPTKV